MDRDSDAYLYVITLFGIYCNMTFCVNPSWALGSASDRLSLVSNAVQHSQHIAFQVLTVPYY